MLVLAAMLGSCPANSDNKNETDANGELQMQESENMNKEQTHTYPLAKIDEAYELFENKCDGVIKVAVEC